MFPVLPLLTALGLALPFGKPWSCCCPCSWRGTWSFSIPGDWLHSLDLCKKFLFGLAGFPKSWWALTAPGPKLSSLWSPPSPSSSLRAEFLFPKSGEGRRHQGVCQNGKNSGAGAAQEVQMLGGWRGSTRTLLCLQEWPGRCFWGSQGKQRG